MSGDQESRTASWSDRGSSDRAASAASRQPGDLIATRYRLLRPLGRGGQGQVYAAEDERLGRTVALKFLPPELTRDEDAKKRFLVEARAAFALDHQNICTVHEIDETDDGRLFISMTYYEGESLRDRIARKRLALRAAVQIAWFVGRGLLKAHERGIVHRDIKPGNIFITKENVVKILDFGLAMLVRNPPHAQAQGSGNGPLHVARTDLRG